jgi:hypothetical protein
MNKLIDLIKQQYKVAECEHLVGPAPCGKLDRLTNVIVLESGLWRTRNVCAECKEEALNHPIGNFHNRLWLALTTDNLEA